MIRTQDSRDEGALVETELCDNCNIAVPSVHFVMHVDFCKRNVQLCQDCGSAVPASQKEQHYQTFHVKVNCSECGVVIAKSEEARHLARHCPQTSVGCRFCPVELPRRNIREHEAICDLKSERCEQCTERVLVKDLARHREVCDGDSELVVLPCEFCCSSMSPNKLMAHQRDCAQQRGIDVPGERMARALPANCSVGTKVVYRGEASGGESHKQLASQVTDVTRCDSQRNSRASSNLYDNVVVLPCEICGDLIPSHKLIQHQKECIENQDRGSRDRGSRDRGRQFLSSAPQKPTFVGVEDAHRTRVTYVSSRAEKEKSLSNLEFEDDTDSDLDLNARFPRSIDTNVFCNETDPLDTGSAFSHRINCHFGRLRKFR